MSFRLLPAISAVLAFSAASIVQAAEPPIPIKAFTQASRFSNPRLSPDGKYLALRVTQELEGRDQKLLNIYQLEGLKLLTTIRLPVFQMPLDFAWVSNTRLVVAKGEDWGFLEQPVFLGEILATDFDGQNQEYLYGKDKFTFQRRGATSGGDDYGWGYIHSVPEQYNGRFFLRETKWDTKSNKTFLYDVDGRTGIKKIIAEVETRELNFLLQHNGVPRYAFGGDDDNRQIVFLRDKDRDSWTRVPLDKLGGSFRPLAFTPDDQKFYVRFSKDGGPKQLMLQSMAGGERTLVAADKIGNIDLVQYGPGTRQPFAAATALGKPSVRYIDENSPEAVLHKQMSKQFPDAYVNFATSSADGNTLLFTVTSDREPGEYYLFNRTTQKAEFLIAQQPLLDAARMAERRPIKFKARDGLEIHGYLTLPQNTDDKKLPLILLPHGGPHFVSDKWFFNEDAQFLASRGYAVLQVNFRGSDGRGDSFHEAGIRQWATGMQQDLIDGVRWATKRVDIDAARVCVFGASFGAYSAMMTAAIEPDMFKCAVGYAGLYDLPMLLTEDATKQSKRRFNFITETIGNDPEEMKKDSPTNQAGKIKAAILLVHGEQDEITPKAQAEAMRAALKNANKDFEWMMVPKEGHGFYAEKNRIAFYERLEAFLAKNLGP